MYSQCLRSPRGGLLRGLLVFAAANLHAQYLFSRAQFPAGVGPVALVAFDFNGNGVLDIATANANGTVSILQGKGDGTFFPPTNYPVGHAPTSIAAGYLSDAGFIDLFVTNSGDNTLSVLIGNRDGSFQPAVNYPTGEQPSFVAAAPFMLHGNLNLVVTNQNCRTNLDGKCDGHTGSISVYIGNGDGTLQAPVETPAGLSPVQVAVGDLAGNGGAEFAVANAIPSPKSVTILNGYGPGAKSVPYGNSVGAFAVTIADFYQSESLEVGYLGTDNTLYTPATSVRLAGNVWTPAALVSPRGVETGNIWPDLIAGINGRLAVLTGNGSGAYQATRYYAGSVDPSAQVESIAVGDFNGDHKPDLATANEINGGPGTLSVFLNQGPAALNQGRDLFSGADNYAADQGAISLVSGDFNRDGKVDIVVADTNTKTPNAGNFSVFLGNGNGTLQAPTDYPTILGESYVTSGDFNKDGNPDLVFVNRMQTPQAAVAVQLGKADGTFNGPVSYQVGNGPISAFVGDFNGDGNPDIAVANRLGKTVSILLGNGNGTFRPPVDYPAGTAPLEYLNSVTGGDFTGDGKLDLIVAEDQGIKFLKGHEDGTFEAPVLIGSFRPAAQISVGDINADGKLDLVVAYDPNPEIAVLLGNGDGTFQAPLAYLGTLRGTQGSSEDVVFSPAAATWTALADFSGSGNLDIAVANTATSDQVSVYLNLPLVSISPSNIGFGPQRVGTTSPPQPVHLNNPSAVQLNITVSVSQNFVVTNDCGSHVAPGSSCTLLVAFAPQNVSASTGTLTIEGNFPGRSASISLSGSAFESPIPQVDSPLMPESAVPGGPALTLTVRGEGFAPQAVILWNATPLVTKFISVTQLTAAVPASDIARAGTAWISVANPLTELSNSDPFEIASPIPTVTLARRDVPTGLSPRAIAVGDFNHDGKQDMAVANFNAGTVSILLGNGDGTFQPHRDYAVGTQPVFVAAGDLNNAGKLDLAVANFGSNTVSILLGNGDGAFQTHIDYATGANPSSVAVGDFQLNGQLDLAITNYGANTVTVLLGSGNGYFSGRVDYAVGTSPLTVAAGDLNGDGLPDLAVANYGSNTVSVLIAESGALGFKFLPQHTYSTGVTPRGLIIADLNNDGKLDVATVNYTPNTVSVLLGTGLGGLEARHDYATGLHPFALVAGDFNDDGKIDIAVADTYCSTSCPSYGYASVLLGNGNGTFQPQKAFVVGSQPVAIAVGDFNGDGRPDLATANFRGNSVSVLLQ